MVRKNPWLEKSTKNLLALSNASNFTAAQSEWKFTGDVVDHEFPSEICELCEHEELRYHYEIKNEETEKCLYVGSSCILRFQEIHIYDADGNKIIEEYERKKELDKALKEKLTNTMLEPLRKLWREQEWCRNHTKSSVDHFKEYGAFLPKQLATLFSRLKDNNINYKPEMFPVYLRSNHSKEQLRFMQKRELDLIKESLTKHQATKHHAVFLR